MYMNVLAAKGRTTVNGGQPPPPHHPGYAWAFVIIFVLGITFYALSVILDFRGYAAASSQARRMA
jgi:hypothetical protein